MVDFGNRVLNRDGSPVLQWRPVATYSLLGVMGGVWLLQLYLYHFAADGARLHHTLFVVDTDWFARPWSPISSTFAHSPVMVTHILFNGLFLYFMGPTVERLLGRKPYVALFVVGGAISGVLQAYLDAFLSGGVGHGALGASGGLMVLMGILMVLTPRTQVLIYGIIPVRLWIMGIVYAVLDVLGIFNVNDGVGHFAHLAGLAIGLGSGWYYKDSFHRRGIRIMTR